LGIARQRGFVHRDLKPANLFSAQTKCVSGVTSGSQEALTNLRGCSDGAGTLAYCSPEQCNYEELGARSDIFAFGDILYELLSGHRPFQGNTPAELINRITQVQFSTTARP